MSWKGKIMKLKCLVGCAVRTIGASAEFNGARGAPYKKLARASTLF